MNSSFRKRLKQYKGLYIFVLVPLLYFAIYHYVPIILQAILSFKEYSIDKGIMDSPWVGWKNYIDIFSAPQFRRLIANTVKIALMRLVVGFVPPIILAIMLYDSSPGWLFMPSSMPCLPPVVTSTTSSKRWVATGSTI